MRDEKPSLTDRQIRKRLLRTLANDCGPARRATLEGLAEHHGARDPKALVGAMIAEGQLVQFGAKRGTRWGVRSRGR